MTSQPPPIVVVIRWQQDSLHHEQAYGPWTPTENNDHLGEISGFMQRWQSNHPDARFTSASIYLVTPPTES